MNSGDEDATDAQTGAHSDSEVVESSADLKARENTDSGTEVARSTLADWPRLTLLVHNLSQDPEP